MQFYTNYTMWNQEEYSTVDLLNVFYYVIFSIYFVVCLLNDCFIRSFLQEIDRKQRKYIGLRHMYDSIIFIITLSRCFLSITPGENIE